MINEESVRAVEAARFKPDQVKPLYDSFNFARIPGTIYNLLTGSNDPALPPSILNGLPSRYDKVILLFVDVFGWRFFEQYSDQYPFLKRFVNDGTVSKLTAQFPSTTAVHFTTIQSGLAVGAHGVLDMAYYEPLVDRVIAPLYFSTSDSGIPAEAFSPAETLHQRLSQKGVKSYLFQDRGDPFSDTLAKGAHQVTPHRTLSEGLINLSEAVLAEPGKAYYFLYYGLLDSLAHIYGPSSRQFAAEVDTCFTTLERLLQPSLEGKVKDTLLLVTADHGQTEISPETTLYLDRLAPAVMEFMKTNRQGERLPPGGSPRNMLLYIRPERLDDAYELLVEAFQERADVRYVRDLVAGGFFGSGEVSETFLNRAADL
jgi:predicted AlkP superfamily pyrophosphatase or phosphodiesterase